MSNPIKQAMKYASEVDPDEKYALHITLTDGRVITGETYVGGLKWGIGVKGDDDLIHVHFINPAHVMHVRLEWL